MEGNPHGLSAFWGARLCTVSFHSSNDSVPWGAPPSCPPHHHTGEEPMTHSCLGIHTPGPLHPTASGLGSSPFLGSPQPSGPIPRPIQRPTPSSRQSHHILTWKIFGRFPYKRKKFILFRAPSGGEGERQSSEVGISVLCCFFLLNIFREASDAL